MNLGLLFQIQRQYVAEIIWYVGPALELLFEQGYQRVTLGFVAVPFLMLAAFMAAYVPQRMKVFIL